jgi:hypothetical protein
MDLEELFESEQKHWLKFMASQEGFAWLVQFCHRYYTQFDPILDLDNQSVLYTACDRASKRIPSHWKKRNKEGLFEEVARFSVRAGNTFDGAARTMFFIARMILGSAGYIFDPNMEHYLLGHFIDCVERKKRWTDLVEMFDKFWQWSKSGQYKILITSIGGDE